MHVHRQSTRIGGMLLANEITPKAPGLADAWGKIVGAGYVKVRVFGPEPILRQLLASHQDQSKTLG